MIRNQYLLPWGGRVRVRVAGGVRVRGAGGVRGKVRVAGRDKGF